MGEEEKNNFSELVISQQLYLISEVRAECMQRDNQYQRATCRTLQLKLVHLDEMTTLLLSVKQRIKLMACCIAHYRSVTFDFFRLVRTIASTAITAIMRSNTTAAATPVATGSCVKV